MVWERFLVIVEVKDNVRIIFRYIEKWRLYSLMKYVWMKKCCPNTHVDSPPIYIYIYIYIYISWSLKKYERKLLLNVFHCEKKCLPTSYKFCRSVIFRLVSLKFGILFQIFVYLKKNFSNYLACSKEVQHNISPVWSSCKPPRNIRSSIVTMHYLYLVFDKAAFLFNFFFFDSLKLFAKAVFISRSSTFNWKKK